MGAAAPVFLGVWVVLVLHGPPTAIISRSAWFEIPGTAHLHGVASTILVAAGHPIQPISHQRNHCRMERVVPGSAGQLECASRASLLREARPFDGAYPIQFSMQKDDRKSAQACAGLDDFGIAKPALIYEIVALHPIAQAKCAQGSGIGRRAGSHCAQCPLPVVPALRCMHLSIPDVTGEDIVQPGQQIVSSIRWRALGKALPGIRELACRILEEPANVVRSGQEQAAKHHACDIAAASGRVRRSQRRSPGSSDHQPAADGQMSAQEVDILQQPCCRVIPGLAQGMAESAAALIELDDPVPCRIEKPGLLRRTARARPAVNYERRDAVWASALGVVNLVSAGDRQPGFVKRGRNRVQGELTRAVKAWRNHGKDWLRPENA